MRTLAIRATPPSSTSRTSRLAARSASGVGKGKASATWANVRLSLGEYRRAIDLYEQALAIIRETGDRLSEAITLGNLGLCYANLGKPRRAIELYEQDLAIIREIGDRRGEAMALGNMGIAHAALGKHER